MLKTLQTLIIVSIIATVFLFFAYSVAYGYSKIFPDSIIAKIIINTPIGEHFMPQSKDSLYTGIRLYQDQGEDFEVHVEQMKQHLLTHTRSMNGYSIQELATFNQPFYTKTEQAPKAEALLAHGLWGSPELMRDLAQSLATHHVASRTILMPGHGTSPADLIDIDNNQLYTAMLNRTKEFIRNTSDNRFLIGHSAGALLLSLSAQQLQEDIDGLILYAPAFYFYEEAQSHVKMGNTLLTYLPGKHHGELNPIFYHTQAIAPINHLFEYIERFKKGPKIDIPTLLYISDQDEVTDYRGVIKFAKSKFTNLTLAIYTTDVAKQKKKFGSRHKYLYSASPEHKVISMSHFGYFIKWGNPLFSNNGPLACYDPRNFECSDVPSDRVMGGMAHIPKHVKISKLTSNPHFSRDMQPLFNFIDKHVAAEQ